MPDERDALHLRRRPAIAAAHGASACCACRIYNTLVGVIKQQYWQRGYTEVVTPNMYNLKLWETSGHAAKYKENMFCFDIESQEFGLKPMNCPGHCIMFKVRCV